MQTFIKLMHSMPSRVARVVGGLWLVIYAADLSPGSAFLLAAVGTAIAVTGIADMCPMELVVNATRARSTRSEERAA
jgi:Protein of unknown function (DUF2892)